MSTAINAKQVKELRDRTGAGMMDAKSALVEADGDFDKAVEVLRVKGQAKAAKRGERDVKEGTVQCYIHANAKVGVLVEIDCETDFVARNEEFVQFAKDIALHIAAADPEFVSEDEVPADIRDRETAIFMEQAADKPENIREKIAEGKLKKWFEEVVLLNQQHVNQDRHDGKSIEQLRAELSAKTGENVVIRRFARFSVSS